jgi:hypothetical protein
MLNNPSVACLEKFSDAESLPLIDDNNLWSTLNISFGLDDSFDQPIDNMEYCHHHYCNNNHKVALDFVSFHKSS